MFGTLPYTLGLLLIDSNIYLCIAGRNVTHYQILFFEYGAHVEGEVLSYQHTDVIPPFAPISVLDVKPQKPDVEQQYTYLRVEYVSPMSTVDITFDDKEFLLKFHVKFPFLNIPFGIVGYSIKALRSRIWDTWRH